MQTRRRSASPRFIVIIALFLFVPHAAAQDLVPGQTRLEFGRITVGGDRCLPLLLQNTTQRPIALLRVDSPVEPFPPAFVDTIPAGMTALVDICYQARSLGPDSALLTIVFAQDAVDSIHVRMSAQGWDSLAIGIGRTITGKPGSVVLLPIRLFGDVPVSYGLKDFAFSLQYNKTMLYPLASGLARQASVAAGMQPSRVEVDRAFASETATVTYRVTGTLAMNNPRHDSVLIRVPFLVLHGNALATDLTLTSVRFADGLPRGGVFLKGRFLADSLCFQDQRLIEYPRREEPEIGSFPNPFTVSTLVRYVLPADQNMRLTVHALSGAEVAVLAEGPRAAGVHVVRFDAAAFPPGTYLCRLETERGSATHTMLQVR